MTDQNTAIAALFAEKQFSSITLVDDVFDPLTVEAISQDRIAQFFAEVEQDDALVSELVKIGVRARTSRELSSADLQLIDSNTEALDKLKEHARTLLADIKAKRADLAEIKANLTELQVGVTEAGIATAVSDVTCKVYLLDYYLGPVNEGSVQAAVDCARRIYDGHPESKPIIVLMSSGKLTQEAVRDFRKRSRLLGGMFQFISKEKLKDKDSFRRKMVAVAKSLPVAHLIEALIQSVEDSLDSVKNEFAERIRDLSLEDYIYVQEVAGVDGHPFGDYLLWLFNADLRRRVFENEDVESKQRAVDALPMLNVPPRQLMPSPSLAEMYKTALFRDMPPSVQPHPQSPERDPLLALGDIFVNSQRELYMVLNPECDLAFSPSSGDRPFPRNKSITLIPGDLQPLHKTLAKENEGKPRTDFFVQGHEVYRIVWDTKRVITKQYGSMNEWLRENQLIRACRLRLMYSLQVQNAYAADFSRIGPPIAPPIFDPVRIELFIPNAAGRAERILGPLDRHAALVTTRKEGGYETRCTLTLEFLEEFCPLLPRILDALSARRKQLESQLVPPAPQIIAPASAPALAPCSQPAAAQEATDQVEEAERTKKLERKIRLVNSRQETVTSFNQDVLGQLGLISPFLIPEIGKGDSLPAPSGLFHIYHGLEVENNFLPEEAIILRLSRVE